MTSPILTIDTPAGPVRATAGPRHADAVVFELGGAMRGSVHVTGTTDPHRWDQFTAVRACLGPVNAFKTTAPDEDLPRPHRLPRQPDPLPRQHRPPRGLGISAAVRR
ncbi:hypothetical protein OHT57_47040 [Streptomyces sp. NBC_00285]|uniref:hypothetical protein n=1 Tax=Streptomyces sp. NBC_00285 TaxID=2975700 RepID=UPI002E2B465B|nr:hypothetical protein [Streptomyces sp. NBC_00285]